MDEYSINEDQRIVQEIAGRFDAPSFIRRAKQVETSLSVLIESLSRLRKEKLEIVRLRLGQMLALAGDWEIYLRWISHPDDVAELIRMHDELEPRLRMPLERTTSQRVLRSSLGELLEAMEAFNQRWARQLESTDLNKVNETRDAFNRYYLVEKECALGSARVARIGYQRQEPIIVEDLFRKFPLLKIPRLKKE